MGRQLIRIAAFLLGLGLLSAEAFAAAPAIPPGAPMSLAITGTPAVGSVVSIPAIPGATCQWTRNGANISGAVSPHYTVQTADIGATVGCNLMILGVIATAAAGGILDFSVAANSQYIPAIFP